MNGFFYSAVSDVLMGPDTATQLGDLAATMGIQRALIVTDPGIIQYALLDGAVANLKANNIELSVYSDVLRTPLSQWLWMRCRQPRPLAAMA